MSVEWSVLPARSLAAEAAQASSQAPAPASSQRFGNLLNALGHELDRGEALVSRAVQRGARRLGPSELIALQAGIYRYSEAMELTAKFVDRAQNAVRTTLESGGG